MKAVNDLTANYVRSILRYDTETGEFYWLWRSDAPLRWNRRFAGTLITNKFKNGRVRIGINYKAYLGSRIAWLYVTGEWPKEHIDHKDTDKSNTKWINLREANTSKNGANQKLSQRSTTKLKGVSWHKAGENYRATMTLNGASLHLGSSSCPAAAHFMYVIAADKAFKEFARFA